MAVAKVILNDVSQIDLTSDTVTAESLLSGYTAHDASGTQITGTASGGGIIPSGTMSITENGTYDVTNYASAEVDVAGGGGGWTEITAASSAATAKQCLVLLFPNATVGSVCHAQIINKAQSDYVENQFIAMAHCHDTSSSYTVAGIRWRSNNYSYFFGSNNYDAVINVGDQYKVMEVAL